MVQFFCSSCLPCCHIDRPHKQCKQTLQASEINQITPRRQHSEGLSGSKTRFLTGSSHFSISATDATKQRRNQDSYTQPGCVRYGADPESATILRNCSNGPRFRRLVTVRNNNNIGSSSSSRSGRCIPFRTGRRFRSGWSWNTPQPRLRLGPFDPNQRRMTTYKSLLTQHRLSMFTAGVMP